MQVNKLINMTKKVDLGVVGATLLSVEEVERLPENLKKCNHWWWLRSSGFYRYFAAYASSGGSVDLVGDYVTFDNYAVRPALVIELGDNWEIGDNFIFGDKEFEIISDELAFCKTDIGTHYFDKETNDYEKSEIKRYVDDWFEKARVE